MNSSASRIAGVSAPASDSTASAAAASSISSCVARINRLRSARSPSAPAGTASSSTGILAAAEMALTSRADVVNESITHWAATVCIHEPMLLTNCADHSRLKSGSCIGAQPDRDDCAPCDDELRPLTREACVHAEAACDAWIPS